MILNVFVAETVVGPSRLLLVIAIPGCCCLCYWLLPPVAADRCPQSLVIAVIAPTDIAGIVSTL